MFSRFTCVVAIVHFYCWMSFHGICYPTLLIISINICHTGFVILIHLEVCIFLPFGVDCLHYVSLSPILQDIFTKNKNILSHNHSTLSQSGYLTLMGYFYLIYDPYCKFISHFSNILHRTLFLLAPEARFNPGSHTTGHVSLVSFDVKWSLSLPVSFMMLRYLELKASYFMKCFSIWVCLLQPHD